jgi:hypothetical protein
LPTKALCGRFDISPISSAPMRITGWFDAFSVRRTNAGANFLNGSSR